MNVFHYGHQDVVGLECTCRQQPLAHRGAFQIKGLGGSPPKALGHRVTRWKGWGHGRASELGGKPVVLRQNGALPTLTAKVRTPGRRSALILPKHPRLRSRQRLGMRKEPSGSWELSTRGFGMQWSM